MSNDISKRDMVLRLHALRQPPLGSMFSRSILEFFDLTYADVHWMLACELKVILRKYSDRSLKLPCPV